LEIKSYQDLKVWQAAMDIAVECYKATAGFPEIERYGLTNQIRRAASSIAANIAEGHGRESTGAFIQFCRIAQGSLKELETHILLSERLGYLGGDTANALLGKTGEIGKMMRSMIRSLQERSQ
jgi:four helix bundle protein